MGEDEEKKTPNKTPLLPTFKRRKQLERDLDHITEQMYRRNRELAETNKTLSLLRTIDGLVLESHVSLKMVCEHITEAITEVTDYAFVGLLTRSTHARDELTLSGWSGNAWLGKQKPNFFARPLHMPLTHTWFSQSAATALVAIEQIPTTELAELLQCDEKEISHAKRALPVKTFYFVKLLARQKVVGLLVVGFYNQVLQLSESDTQLLDRLSEGIGVALDNKLLFEENQYVLRKLRDSNANLKALDETKDDFISMASHQLRTPLTSVKGYLSMVLEGDAGKLTPMQHEMLGQAFFSSQRMVYLISDLLNVSRLKTGKFVIEPTSVNLANMVREELGQLQETAASRQVTLEYDQPADFPDLMFDETKIRQVIMNFVDNAIYYTPADGHITVRVINKPSTIELRVEDSGIGVPKAEQKHLFTKFYRAGNARKARPDGTGLGLYMAKKVIVAQGGSTLFESQEGKGSMFGFVFSKSHLSPASVDQPAAAATTK